MICSWAHIARKTFSQIQSVLLTLVLVFWFLPRVKKIIKLKLGTDLVFFIFS